MAEREPHVTVRESRLEYGPCRNLTGRLDVTDAIALISEVNAAGLCQDAARWVDAQITPTATGLRAA